MKTVRVITAFLLSSVLALSASAADYVPSAEAYEPEVVVTVDPNTEKEYHAAIVDSNNEVVEYIFNDTVAQVVASFIDSGIDKEHHDRFFTSTEITQDGSVPVVKEEVKQLILEAEEELIQNPLSEIVEDFEEKWTDTTEGAPVQQASIAKVFYVGGSDEIKEKVEAGKGTDNAVKVKFQFKINEVTQEDNFVLLQKPADSDKWVVEDYTIDENNVITIEIDEFSAFAVIVDKPVDPTPGQDSPQTGVAKYSAAVIACAVAFCGAAFVVIRKASRKDTAA